MSRAGDPQGSALTESEESGRSRLPQRVVDEPNADAEVISLAHARGSDACMPSGLQEDKHACIADFDELVRPVGLVGPNREVCRAAYLEAPAEFAALVDDALHRGHVPAALLVRRVKDGDHRRLAARSAPRQPREQGPSLLEQRLHEEYTRA